MVKKEMIAMILAGGQGTRLKNLTKKIAKPAVPFGAKYRIIDFTLSNCINSGIDTVGVLTQYRPLSLLKHIGSGIPFDLNRLNGGVVLLSPYVKESEGYWYAGTAHAIFENIDFMNEYDPTYALILSGDHIYKMDYSKMLDFHKEKNANVTIATINVSFEEASRFGILNTNENNMVEEFEEKPKIPKSTKASMGVYIFNYQLLKDTFEELKSKGNNFQDFGHNILPYILKKYSKIFAYEFNGYWKDVGTISTFYEANLDLIKNHKNLDLREKNWTIFTKSSSHSPQYITSGGNVVNSLVANGAKIEGHVSNSVIFENVKIGKNTIIEDSVIMSNAIIGENSFIKKTIIMENTVVKEKMVLNSLNNQSLNEEDGIILYDGKEK
ncbi:glucose-1-phosphate adenylyltransferase [[Mycoplasma] mobile]|uniref:Glucose-1-phosphate adenylyltransferase n=1 Tax=Mycoplasma mobile (strain ATCC 43663 / 163K / NCTC 11711) TaxID=267748 RepID=GLGC_MYCM1|nr:glucose-1-phosphate adenylyltransferase [[Mycoplasma] mobile]Q6KHP5.1 RecName: Full=Glucose-1-phosphate adenylyltransferase; AltName: Full=ADP-glucose pyrophosphorylase; Short=ADPGlc PPase; AltName: Full=ADP-glucose synthase [Mycoplasma mobile 163K]AAT27885.1 glucose-1-phosphate adenylyltransferase [Mycoplasma mobile 163K]